MDKNTVGGLARTGLGSILVPSSSNTQPKAPRPYQIIALIAVAVAVISVSLLALFYSPEIDASFNIKNMEKSGNGFIMSIGEESSLEWEIEPETKGVMLDLPEGLEYLGGDLEYKNGNEGVVVRAVRVGKWHLGVHYEKRDYAPEEEYFVCIGVSHDDARKYCE